MRVGMVSPFVVPHPTGGGVAMVNWAMMRTLVERGHEVMVYSLVYNDRQGKPPSEIQGHVQLAAKQGAHIDVFALDPDAKISSNTYHTSLAAQELAQKVSADKIEALFVYTVSGMEAVAEIDKAIPRLCALVDLDHQVQWYRRQYQMRTEPIPWEELEYIGGIGASVEYRMIELLKQADAVVELAAHHAEYLRGMKIPCSYYPTPVVDHVNGAPFVWKDGTAKKPTFMMAGHINGIATMSGLYYMVEQVLVELDKLMAPNSYEIRIIGADQMSPELAQSFSQHPSVKIIGWVDDIEKEYKLAHAMVVPTPIPLGFRTRCVEAMGHGKPLISHSANRFGMPEMVHDENVLLGSTGKQIAEHMARIGAATPDGKWIRSYLGQAARKTFVERLDAKISCAAIAETLEGLVV